MRTTARLSKKFNKAGYCPVRIKEVFEDPTKLAPTSTRYRAYFPKYQRKHDGQYELEVLIDGIYFQHDLKGDLIVGLAVAVTVSLLTVAFVVFVFWWVCKQDLVGSSNIAAFIVAVAAICMVVLLAPFSWRPTTQAGTE